MWQLLSKYEDELAISAAAFMKHTRDKLTESEYNMLKRIVKTAPCMKVKNLLLSKGTAAQNTAFEERLNGTEEEVGDVIIDIYGKQVLAEVMTVVYGNACGVPS